MKNITLLFLLFISLSSYSQDGTTFILVRHAEKSTDDPKDPSLSAAGMDRALELASLLAQSDITAIYSTPYKRTRMTVAPLADQLNLPVSDYSPSDLNKVASELLEKHKGGTILISGHSNTTPFLANALLKEQRFEQFDESDYGNILLIFVDGSGKSKLLHVRF